MSDLIAVAVVDLKAGPVLDWAVAKALGAECAVNHLRTVDIRQQTAIDLKLPWTLWCGAYGHGSVSFCPSTSWAQAGILIASHKPDLMTTDTGFVAYLNNDERSEHGLISGYGETYLEAACKSIVAAKFGDAVTVPRELVEVAK